MPAETSFRVSTIKTSVQTSKPDGKIDGLELNFKSLGQMATHKSKQVDQLTV